MKTLISLLAAACLAGAAFAQASNPPPAPGPEAQKMSVGYGEWTYEGAYQATPLGPAEKFTGRMSGRPVLNGFTGEFAYREKSDSRETEQLELNWYDPAARSYSYVVLGSDGYIEEGPFAFNGNVCTWEAKGSPTALPSRSAGRKPWRPTR